MSNIFKLCPTHFSRGAENFSRGTSPPGYGPAYEIVKRLGTTVLEPVPACRTSLTITNVHNTPSRCTISTCVLHFLTFNFLVSCTCAQHSRATIVRFDVVLNWLVSIQISLEVSFSLKVLVYWRVFNKDLFENESPKEKFSSMDRLGQ